MKRLTSRCTDGRVAPNKHLCAATDLEILDRLAAYEDTGLEPEEIQDLMSVREISPEMNGIEHPCKECKSGWGSASEAGPHSCTENCERLARCLAQQEAEKNEPLTLDELREMDGEPVYDWMGYEWFVISEITDDEVIMTDGTIFDIDEDSPNHADRRFCRRKPEEAEAMVER